MKENTPEDSQFYQVRLHIDWWLKEMEIENYIINDDLTVDVSGSVLISQQGLDHIKVKFGKVAGDFSIHSNNLTSLKGSPEIVGGKFFCAENKITSLEFAPKIIGKTLYCHRNPILNFENLDIQVGENIVFTCPANLDYLNAYKQENDTHDNVYINFKELKKIQALKNLKERLNDDLPTNTTFSKKLKV